jgi:hypothetical protein
MRDPAANMLARKLARRLVRACDRAGHPLAGNHAQLALDLLGDTAEAEARHPADVPH